MSVSEHRISMDRAYHHPGMMPVINANDAYHHPG